MNSKKTQSENKETGKKGGPSKNTSQKSGKDGRTAIKKSPAK